MYRTRFLPAVQIGNGFTSELGELVWFEAEVRWNISLLVSFSKAGVYFRKSADDSRFYCAGLCCPSNPEFGPQLISHSNIYWFQLVRDELLVAVDWANHLII